jgi:hypothetical protein
MAGIASSQWIGKAAAIVWREHQPQLQWVYVPHLDYDLQRFGPESEQAKAAVRDAAGAVEPLVNAVLESGGQIVLLSEYAMRSVDTVVQPNLVLREAGLLIKKTTEDGELVDFERSSAFAMVDHQIAHVYAKSGEEIDQLARVMELEGIRTIERSSAGIRHRRCGDLILIAEPNAWFDYRWWDDADAIPTFAKMVDIHRKPGYDPLELFWDRATNGISQNRGLIKGSHGIVETGEAMIAGDFGKVELETVAASQVAALIGTLLDRSTPV